MSKYNNGQSMPVPEKEEEIYAAITEWAEGNPHLQGAISSCIDNGIPTFASCKGHNILDFPYLSLRVTAQNIEKVVNIMDTLSNKVGISILLSFEEFEQQSILTITSNMINRNNIFDLIASSAQTPLNFKDANNVIQDMIRTHEILRVFGLKFRRMQNDIEMFNGIIGKSIVLKHTNGCNANLLDLVLNKKRKPKDYYRFYFTKLNQINEDLLHRYFETGVPLVEDDDFIKFLTDDGIVRKIKIRTINESGNRCLEKFFNIGEIATITQNKIKQLERWLRFNGINLNDIKKRFNMNTQLEIKLNRNQTLELVQGFFDKMDIDISQLLRKGKYIKENGQAIYLTINKQMESNKVTLPIISSKEDSSISIIETGSLEDVYSLVHEISHAWFTQNGLNTSSVILGEVIPRCMERMLGSYLQNLTHEEKLRFGINSERLKKDIRNKKIMTTFNSIEAVPSVNKCKKKDKHQRVEASRYLLAQIYSIQFTKLCPEERKNKILTFASALRQDNIEKANMAFGMQIYGNAKYIDDSITDLKNLLLDLNSEGNNGTPNKNRRSKREI